MENWIIKIVDRGYKLTRDIYIYRKSFGGKLEILRGNTVETIDDSGAVDKPSLELTPEVLQSFANALNEIGINPKKEFIEGKLEATEKHFEDMRKLLFKK